MTAFELLAYAASFILFITPITCIICAIIYVSKRNKAVKEYLKRKGGNLDGDKSNKEK